MKSFLTEPLTPEGERQKAFKIYYHASVLPKLRKDSKGHKTLVVLPACEFDALLEELEGFR